MKAKLLGVARGAAVSALMLVSAAAMAKDIRIGVIGPFSGPQSLYGTGWQQAITIYMDQHGNAIAGNHIEFIYRDLPAPDPKEARALAVQLIVHDKVDYLMGFDTSADALSVASAIEQAKIPTIALNAGSANVISSSKYMLRAGFTMAQNVSAIGDFAANQHAKTAVTMVTDFISGREAEESFLSSFEKRGGKVLEKIRMPLSTTDFGPFLQRARLAKPDVIYAILPGGPATYSYMKAYIDSGMPKSGIRYLGTGETQEFDLQAMGDGVIGLETGFIYSAAHDSDLNRQYAAALKAKYPNAVLSLPHAEAYDAMAMIAKMIEATKGEHDGDAAIAAVKGMSWEGIRGPLKIDPTTKGFIQNVYMRRVERDKTSGLLVNREYKTYTAVPEGGLDAPK
ncbi:ABC transporter substrate-binding protein [Pararobbsia silviterrae]|uniref:ABC transporter substrate-binding protein n=1 Tax=Pararobbsia silviterrae TaxID=1792498 RepID=UPI001314855C|nr:ABC transporter substrate-binding protein [Pararobbsia silviterrae]